MGFNCEPCTNCGKTHINQYFNPSNSSTSSTPTCGESVKKGISCRGCVDDKCAYHQVRAKYLKLRDTVRGRPMMGYT